jgi:hypothetical protein
MYSSREDWLQAAVAELRPVFDSHSFPLPEKIRVTCGFPSSRAKSNHKNIGEHWSPSASQDGTHEILISPVVDDVFDVFGILVHELCHAATDGDGHGKEFGKIATGHAVGGQTDRHDNRSGFQRHIRESGLWPGGLPTRPFKCVGAQGADHPDAQGILPRLRLHNSTDQQVGQPWLAVLPAGWIDFHNLI